MSRAQDQVQSTTQAFEQGNLSMAETAFSDELTSRRRDSCWRRPSPSSKSWKIISKPERFGTQCGVEKARAEELSKQMAWVLAKREGETS